MASRIETSGNRLRVVGRFELSDLRRFTAALYNLTTKMGYEDVVLDFADCGAAYPGPMVAVCAEVLSLRGRGIEAAMVLPSEPRLARLFTNANWAHLIDPPTFRPTTYRGYVNLPVLQFATAEEQTKVVNRLVDAMLCSIPAMDRADFAAIEWSLNEVTDNVLVHAQSAVGGLVQLSSFRARRRVEFSVADAGLGIPATMRQGLPHMTDDGEALERAIREGVTRDPQLGQGNGLYGTLEVARTADGYIHIHSGYARLAYQDAHLRISREDVPFTGTLIVACMDYSNPAALGEALRFGDKKYSPLDYIETHFEDGRSAEIVFRLIDEAVSFGSRVAGEPVRMKLSNLIHMNPTRRILIDFADVPIISSSFADEVFGKLFVQLGPLRFGQALQFRGVSATVGALVDKAILQRSSGVT